MRVAQIYFELAHISKNRGFTVFHLVSTSLALAVCWLLSVGNPRLGQKALISFIKTRSTLTKSTGRLSLDQVSIELNTGRTLLHHF